MTFAVIQLIFGLSGLVYGANMLIKGALGLAQNYQWPKLWVGTVLVGLATTLPEIIVSVIAVLQGHPHISLGNALGSYVANIGLVLGLTAMIQPLSVHKKLLRRELPLLTLALIILAILITDFHLSVQDGCILLLALVGFFWLISKNTSVLETIEPDAITSKISLSKAYGLFILGTAILWLSGDFMITAAAKLAQIFGMSEWAIGLTVVAVGTSLPELAASVVSARQGHHDLAIGNVIGSNILSILGVVAIPSILAPGQVPSTIIQYDLSGMALITLSLWLFSIKKTKRNFAEISRTEGALLLVLFIMYLYFAATAT